MSWSQEGSSILYCRSGCNDWNNICGHHMNEAVYSKAFNDNNRNILPYCEVIRNISRRHLCRKLYQIVYVVLLLYNLSGSIWRRDTYDQ